MALCNKTIFIANPNAPTGLCLKKEDIEQLSDAKDTVYVYKKNRGSVFNEYLRKATLSFGGETALSNYSSTNEKPSVYKSVESLMNEFCALCPSKKDYSMEEPKKAHDRDGNEIKTDDKSSVSNLTWLTAKSQDDKDKNIIFAPNNPIKDFVGITYLNNDNIKIKMTRSKTIEDIFTLVHEYGHALNMKKNPKLYNNEARTHFEEIESIFLELILCDYLVNNGFNKDDINEVKKIIQRFVN